MYQHAKYTDLKNALQNNKFKNFCVNKITKKSPKPNKKKKNSDNDLEIPNIRRKESRSVFQHTRLLQNL